VKTNSQLDIGIE